jgi:hypothetical protein
VISADKARNVGNNRRQYFSAGNEETAKRFGSVDLRQGLEPDTSRVGAASILGVPIRLVQIQTLNYSVLQEFP